MTISDKQKSAARQPAVLFSISGRTARETAVSLAFTLSLSLLLIGASGCLALSKPVKSEQASKSEGKSTSLQAKEVKRLCAEGLELTSENQFETALTKYTEANRLAPDDETAILGLGVSYYNLKRYYAALEWLDKELKLNQASERAWLTRARTMQNIDRLDEAIADYKRYLSLSADKEEKSRYEALVAVLAEQLKQNQARKKSEAKNTRDYLKSVTEKGTWRWPADRLPISYYVYPPGHVTDYKPEYDEILRQALFEWADASDDRVDFIRVYSPEEASLTVTWTDNLHAPNLVAEAGFTNWQGDENGIKRADIKLLTVSPFKGERMTNFLMHNICLHEIGHALGIGGHSPDQDDIMYPSCFLQTGISPADRNTLLELYGGDGKPKAEQEAPPATGQNQAK